MDPQRITRFIKFVVIGIEMGVTEDIIVIAMTTDVEISSEMVEIVVVVSLPFAALLELVVDHPVFGYFKQLVEHVLTNE